MNYLGSHFEAWVASPFAKALGWSLIHFLWEGVLIALLLAVLLFLCRRASARLRYALACLALLAMPLALCVTLALSSPSHPAAPIHPRVVLDDADSASTTQASPAVPSRIDFKACLPWVAPFWMAGVLVFYLRSLGSWIVAQRLRRAGVCAAPNGWQTRLHGLCERMQLSKPVVLLESCLVDVPVVMGFVRPVILMPMGLLAGLSTDQLESILIHELAHIRRWDYVANLLQNLVEGLLFYHPAVWWVSGQVRAERENCCDDVVVNLKGDARGYAAALATLEQNRWPAHEPALAATGGSLMKRIRRLLQEPERHRASAAPVFVAGLLVVSLGVAVASWQTTPSPAPNSATSQSPSLQIPDKAALRQILNPKVEAELAGGLDQEIASQSARLASVDDKLEEVVRRVTEAYLVTALRHHLLQSTLDVAMAEPRVQEIQGLTAAVQTEFQEVAKRHELETPYRRWLNEDVAYIITDEERAAYKNLPTDEEREKFIERFWMRRDPAPGTAQNEFREEHYRRIAYANQHYGSSIPGWKTDRGRVYITYGPPDEINSHPSGGAYQQPPEQGGGTITTVPFEQWTYRHIDGVGDNVMIEFVDPTKTGEYHQTTDPADKDAARLFLPASVNDAAPASGATPVKAGATVQVMGTAAASGKAVLITIPLSGYGSHSIAVTGTISSMSRQPVANFKHTIQGPQPEYSQFVALAPGTYVFKVLVRDAATGAVASDEITFEVK